MKRYATNTSPQKGRIRSRDSQVDRRILQLKAKGLTHTQVAERINRQFDMAYNSNNIGVRLYRIRHDK